VLGVGREGPLPGSPIRGRPSSIPLIGASGVTSSRSPSGAVEREAWTVLSSIHGLGPVTFATLLRRFGSGTAVLDVARRPHGRRQLTTHSDDAVAAETPISADLAAKIVDAAERSDDILERVRREGLTVVTLEDETFPARLRAIEMPPHLLYVRGDPVVLSRASAVAVVGTRRPSEYGRLIAARIAGALARVGSSVVSGLAVGIDGAAHAGAVAEVGATVAVLGGGHGRLFPRAHRRLAEVIVDTGGAVVSELPPDSTPTRGTFPRRNRLISGLADATVVVEAAAKSGALITAGWALEQGRPCFLVPGAIGDPTSAGCLRFLREFPELTRIVAGVPELLEDLGLARPVQASVGGRAGAAPTAQPAGPGRAGVLAELAPTERAVAEALLSGQTSADDLVAVTQLPVATVLGVITLLEIRGLVSAAYGRYRPIGLLASN
jgi:DNA processing protein